MILTVFSPQLLRKVKRWGLVVLMTFVLFGLGWVLWQPSSQEVQPPLPPDHWPEKPLRVWNSSE